jgi:hypothetical protein
MEELSKYWTLVKLSSSGDPRSHPQADAQDYFAKTFPHASDLPERTLQTQLFQQYQTGEAAAGLCLRCWISHTIIQICRSLVSQFGDTYKFSLPELLTYVLDDEGALTPDPYIPMAIQVLRGYNPAIAALSTWTTRLVKQNHDLNRCLMEHGLYLVSDWAILNDTKPDQLKRIWIGVYNRTSEQAEQAALILESYRAIYLPDRIAKKSRGKCLDPTPDQLQRIAALLGSSVSPDTVLSHLRQIAKQLRQYRLERYGSGNQSFENPAIARAAEGKLIQPDPEEKSQVEVFWQAYQTQFVTCLDAALERVVRDRVTKLKTEPKTNQFLTALKLFHCQRIAMKEIARQLGLPRQDSVTHLLKLKALRADVQLHMLTDLPRDVSTLAKAFVAPTRLAQLGQAIQNALEEQVADMLIAEDKKNKTPKEYLQGSLFSERLCLYLDRH